MPVISSRRSSNSASGSLYRTTTGTGGTSASSTSSNTSTTTFSKPSSYYSFLNSYSPASYTPNTSAYRSSSSYTPSTYLSGGSSTLGTYRSTASQFESSLNDRYGLNKKPPSGDTLRRGDLHTNSTNNNTTTANNTSGSSYDSDRLTKRPPTGESTRDRDFNNTSSNRLSASLSSSSLARYVATSALDIYEKYSPAHYKPNTDLTRSSSRSSLVDANESSNNSTNNTLSTNYDNNNDVTTHVTLERPRSRYSRLYSNDSPLIPTTSTNATDFTDGSSTLTSRRRANEKLYNSSSANALNLSQSNSSNDVPTATFTLRSRALSSGRSVAKSNLLDAGENGVDNKLKNGIGNGLDKELKELKLKHDTTTTTTTNNNNYNNNNNNNGTYTTTNDVEVSVTLKLDENKQNDKVRSSSMAIPSAPPTPTSSRYYERSSNRNSTHTPSSSSYISNGEGDSGNSSLGTENREGLVGLRNIGNTCFMNSIIQCLSHTSELTSFLRQYDQTTNSRVSAKDQQILNEFARLIKEMWSGLNTSSTPMELKRAFSSKHRMYSDYNQQDAQEFLRFFLDSLHCGLNTGVKGEPLKIDENLSDNKKAELTWEWYSRHENSLIRDLFVGQLKSTLRCTVCGNTSVTFDPFWDLSVSLPSSTRCKLEQCLDMFIREEVLDGDEMPTCSKCKTRRKCTKSFTIQRFPKYLVIHLKRFSETRWSKLSNMVEFPTEERELNMGPYGSNANTNVYYTLYGISNHMGSTAGGHYVAVCKHPHTRRWHEFNDNVVSSADKAHLVSASAYILFYERA